MDAHRAQWLDSKAKTCVDSSNPKLLVKSGIMMRSELPAHCQLWDYKGEQRCLKQCIPNKFIGNTFVDGTCIPCQEYPELSTAGYGVGCVCRTSSVTLRKMKKKDLMMFVRQDAHAKFVKP